MNPNMNFLNYNYRYIYILQLQDLRVSQVKESYIRVT